MKRRWVALVLALAFAGPLAAPLVASARVECARCAGVARCCCAPARGAGGCGLARPCGPASGGEGVMAPQDLEKAPPEAPVTLLVPPAPAPTVRADSPFEPADLPAVPPDPPPEASL
jgi:hypothetical protein